MSTVGKAKPCPASSSRQPSARGHGRDKRADRAEAPQRTVEALTEPEVSQLLTRVPFDAPVARRARSATDAGVLRRKGRLKEQDQFIDFIVRMHETHSCEEVMHKLERWVSEHRRDPSRSRLSTLVPAIGNMFTDLPLVKAFTEYDQHFCLSQRSYVPPNFAEIRHILNIAQVHASAGELRLITFDADGTLYADGCHLEQDNRMIDCMIELLRQGVHVAIVTAAGYPGAPHLFEKRIQGLLDAFVDRRLPERVTRRFLMLGGECNYLLRYNHAEASMEFVPEADWKSPAMRSWQPADIAQVLDAAQVVRKERAVGIVPRTQTVYEVLEDLAITVRCNLVDAPVPFCAFNGGADVFVDIGNKSLGLHALMKYTAAQSCQTLHVGDRFTASGNDNATRDICAILWVASPEETGFFIDLLLSDIAALRDRHTAAQ